MAFEIKLTIENDSIQFEASPSKSEVLDALHNRDKGVDNNLVIATYLSMKMREITEDTINNAANIIEAFKCMPTEIIEVIEEFVKKDNELEKKKTKIKEAKENADGNVIPFPNMKAPSNSVN